MMSDIYPVQDNNKRFQNAQSIYPSAISVEQMQTDIDRLRTELLKAREAYCMLKYGTWTHAMSLKELDADPFTRQAGTDRIVSKPVHRPDNGTRDREFWEFLAKARAEL